MLTQLQLQHFDTFGFVILRGLFTPEEVEILRREYEAELDYVYTDQPFTGEKRYWTTMLHPRTPLYASLLEDERFSSVAEQIYGDDVIGICADANRYVGLNPWLRPAVPRTETAPFIPSSLRGCRRLKPATTFIPWEGHAK